MNGRVGRERTLRRIRNEHVRRAIAAGVDSDDRAAIDAWIAEDRRQFYDRLNRELREKPKREANRGTGK